MGAGCAEFAMERRNAHDFDDLLGPLGGELQADLQAAAQLDIDLRQQLGVEQCAVLYAVAAVDAVASAQRIERMLGSRMPAAGDRQRVDHPLERKLRMAADAELEIE